MAAPTPSRPARSARRREALAARLHARRAWRMAVIVGVAVLGGLAAALFARLCDQAMRAHDQLYRLARWPTLLLLPFGFALAAWLTRRFAPEAAGSGIPQVIAAAERRWHGRWGGQRVTLKTAGWKVSLTAALLVCGASIGREGPTVQVVAGIVRALTRGLRGGPGRRAIIIAGGAAGVAAAFNTPIAGVVFGVEELAKGFERRTHTTVILVVVLAGLASYALQGDYAYFGVFNGEGALASAWLWAPLVGATAGVAGGVFSRALAEVIGPGKNPVARWRRGHPVVFAFGCGFVALATAVASGGLTFGAGYAEAKSLLQDHPGRGFSLAVSKFVASLAASASGIPGGIFAPSLATGAGIGAAFARSGLSMAGRDAVVLGMAGYLSGVVQAPLTSAVILMEMTRDPGLVGPLMLAALVGRWTSGLVMREPIYHLLAASWRPPEAPPSLPARPHGVRSPSAVAGRPRSMRTPDLVGPVETGLTGFDLINRPLLNKGTAFTEDERTLFRLHGLLPPHVGTLDEQVSRRLRFMRRYAADFERYAFLRELQDTNETLFYALMERNLEELLPIVYTPTVGEGCQRFSEIWRKPRGVFLSYPNKARIPDILADPTFDDVRVIVVSDGERILGLGDQGAGGMGIPIGKLSLYTGCAGIHPAQTLPVLLDVGTNNQERLDDPVYIGWRHARVTGADYDDFIEAFVSAVIERWPNVLLQWEDFAGSNAGRLLERYRDRLCTFNDDIQGTAAVAAATIMSAVNVTGTPLTEQRIAFLGAGSAGSGIAALLLKAMVEAGADEAEARARFFAVDRPGLLVEGMNDLTPAQAPFAQRREALAGWTLRRPGRIDLHDVAVNAKPTVLIGASGQAGAFTEDVIRAMAAGVERPAIFPLSNPTSRSEATAEQLVAWTDGRALIGTGSPFAPVAWNGRTIPIDQTNNSYVFPGIGLGVLASGARRVTDGMFMAAAKAVAHLSPTAKDKGGRLLPPVDQLRAVSLAVAEAVARQAQADGVADIADDVTLSDHIAACVWEPRYRRYRKTA